MACSPEMVPLTDVRSGGFIVRANQGKMALPHVAQPKPELCGSAWAILKTFIAPQLSLSAASAIRRTSPAHRESNPEDKVYWRTYRPSTAVREARFQIKTLPAVGCAGLLGFFYLSCGFVRAGFSPLHRDLHGTSSNAPNEPKPLSHP